MNRQTLTRLAVLSIVLLAALGASGGVSAQNATLNETAPYYDGADEPDTSGWFEGVDPTTLSGLVAMIGRVGTFIIGGGASGVSGSLLTGVAVAGIGVGSVARANVGGVAGAVLGITAVFTGAATGIAPQWISAVLMFAIGLVVASVLRRVVT
ncbi:hypothetical protein PM023_16215 [Halorubrum ezzemoulense]|uniref:hypothetical protein n=1 Tax=Halorubrum ezzemoulense TaxID=337243 RepID=UPI00232F0040|nr:hypothetical protein [Halorubrum ezzemoulense]MDB2226192.1 hypothetical protein [Halorubrum ezzemoulense]